FFSSRRRHTRWPRDWSSDVCSSDLSAPSSLLPCCRGNCRPTPIASQPELMPDLQTTTVGHVRVLRLNRPERKNALTSPLGWAVRSEERRVGKEWRSRGGRAR